MVEIEQHSYCNRKCWFCPNTIIDRQKPVQYFNERIYRQILADLASIEYSQVISFSGNCEPFSQPDFFIERIKMAAEALPGAFLSTNSNTDYLTTDIVRRASQAGLDVLKAQLYFDRDEEYTEEAVDAKMDRLGKKLRPICFAGIEGQWYALEGNLVIHAYAKNFHRVGHNRCDVEVRDWPQKRFHTCFEPVQYIGVNYEGYVTPCCNLRGDYKPHQQFMLGRMIDCSDESIFDYYHGVILSETEYPCKMCMGKHGHANLKLCYQDIRNNLRLRRERGFCGHSKVFRRSARKLTEGCDYGEKVCRTDCCGSNAGGS